MAPTNPSPDTPLGADFKWDNNNMALPYNGHDLINPCLSCIEHNIILAPVVKVVCQWEYTAEEPSDRCICCTNSNRDCLQLPAIYEHEWRAIADMIKVRRGLLLQRWEHIREACLQLVKRVQGDSGDGNVPTAGLVKHAGRHGWYEDGHSVRMKKLEGLSLHDAAVLARQSEHRGARVKMLALMMTEVKKLLRDDGDKVNFAERLRARLATFGAITDADLAGDRATT